MFLSTLSHELRNPLAPLTNAVYLIRRAAPGMPALDAPLQIIDRQLANLRRLVDDLMDLSRIGAGKVELRKQPVVLQEIFRRAVESVQPQVRDHGHVLQVLAPTRPMVLDADATRLEQVFINLLHNAVKYTPAGGRIWIKCTGEGEEAVVRFEDTGVGIPRDMLPRIFELFTQVESSRAQAEGGLGIGLALVKKLVSLHGGTVQVSSEGPGKGSEFTVRLPLRAAEPAPESELEPETGASASAQRRSSASTADPASAGMH